MTRKLASIQKIVNIEPIEGADKIEKLTVLGWHIVASKSENHNIGDLICYIEPDSRVPEIPMFEFLKDRKYIVKTIKLRKQVSQGLVIPLRELQKNFNIDIATLKEGQDVTDLLGITKYDPEGEKEQKLAEQEMKKTKNPIHKFLMRYKWYRKIYTQLFVHKKGGFPQWIKKTDEERCLSGRTKIEKNKGKIEIKDIVNSKNKILIKSFNLKKNIFEYKEIENVQKIKNSEDLLEIEFINKGCTNRKNRIVCSKDHKFLTPKGYICAQDLSQSSRLYEYNNCYPDDIMPIIYGMCLGDTHISFENRLSKNGFISNNLRLTFCQGESQKEYLLFKKQIFSGENCKIVKGKSGYCSNNVYSMHTKIDKTISDNLNELCIKNRKFIVTSEFCEKLEPISLAFWYMDDGSLKHVDDNNISPNIIISSNSFSKEENELLINCLNKKFGIEANLRREKKYWSIYITTEGTKKFLKLISPYIHPCLRYKTLKEYRDIPFKIKDLKFQKEETLCEKQILSIKPYTKKIKYLYDITVKDNHNFISNNILSHNCQTIPNLFQECVDKKIKFDATEKIDRSICNIFYRKT